MWLIYIDAHSKYAGSVPMRSPTGLDFVGIMRQIFSTFGLVEQLVTDNGPQFVSEEFRKRHLVVTHVAVRTSPVLATLFSEPVGEFSPRKDDDESVIAVDDESADESDDATPPMPPPPAKRRKLNVGSSVSKLELNVKKAELIGNQLELAMKRMAGKFPKDDFRAAETLVEYCMSNLGSLHVGGQERALQDLQRWLNGNPNEAQSSLKTRALNMLTEARSTTNTRRCLIWSTYYLWYVRVLCRRYANAWLIRAS